MGLFSFLAKRRTIYLRVFPDKMEVRDIDFRDSVTEMVDEPFSSEDSLISDFAAAEKLFRKTLWNFETGKFFRRDFSLLIQPLADYDLSETELNKLKNVGTSAGADLVAFTTKKQLLTDDEIMELVRNAKQLR